MNAAQARAVGRLLEALAHPAKDVWGDQYTPGEISEADVAVRGNEAAGGVDVVSIDFAVPRPTSTWVDVVDGLSFTHRSRCELGVSASGVVVMWSTLRIPRPDWDAEMVAEETLREVAGDVPPIFEVECWRPVSYRWSPDDAGSALRWVFRVEAGSPLVDPLPAWRRERDAWAARTAA